MRFFVIALLLAIATPLGAQVKPERPEPFDDVVYVSQEPLVPGLYRIPLVGQLFRSGTPTPISANHGQVQAAIDRAMAGVSNTTLLDFDSVLLASAAKSIMEWEDPDGQIRKFLGGLTSVQVRMFDVDGDVRAKLQPVRDLLKAPQWARYTAYTSGQDVVELWSGREAEKQTGVLMLSISGKSVFLMNVVGDIVRPQQLIFLRDGSLWGIPDLKLGARPK